MMPHSLELVVPADKTDGLSGRLIDQSGVLSLRITRGTSVKPPGDVIALEVLDGEMPRVMEILDDHGVGREDGTSLTSNLPLAVLSGTDTGRVLGDTNESSFEEIEQTLSREGRPTVAVLALMTISGVLATIGIAQSALHLVIAAMIIAPGFVPIVLAVFGALAGGRNAARGVAHTTLAYGALLSGAAVAAIFLTLSGRNPTGSQPSYDPPLVSVDYWTTVTPEAAVVTLAAGLAGALVIATNRAILTAGVMVALALVPAAALVAIGATAGDWPLAGAAAVRWLVDVVLLSVASAGVLVAKKQFVHRGRSLV